MADIRINSLPTTASASSSDDFLALDGATNGTRKLNAYSPTFGGNLTVSGVTTSAGISNSGALTFTAAIGQVAGSIAKNATYGLTYYGVTGSSNDNTILNASGAVVLSNPAGTTNATLTGNLTVSGTGTSSVAGSLGIGTTSPTRPLDVRGSLGMQVNEDNAGTKVISIRSDFASAGPAINVTTNDPLLFLTNNSERARITSSGNLGIGTTDIQGKLHVRGSQADPLLRLGYEVAGQSYLDFLRTSVDAVPVIQSGYGVDGSFALAINPSGGNLLIGTTTDGGQKLQVSGNGLMTTGLTLGTSVVGGTGLLTLVRNSVISWNANSSTQDQYIYANGSSSLIFGTANTTALTLDSSQNAAFAGSVGIGTTSPQYSLQVSSTNTASYYPLALSSGVIGTIGNTVGMRFGYTGNTYQKGAIIFESTSNNAVGKLHFALNAAENASNVTLSDSKFVLTSSGDATFAGNITANGGRITCSSTSDIRNFVATGNLTEVGFQWANTGTGAKTYTAWSTANSSGLGANGSWILRNETDSITPISVAPVTGNVTFSGAIAIGNTVQTAASVASTHKVTISIGGSTYYLLATNV